MYPTAASADGQSASEQAGGQDEAHQRREERGGWAGESGGRTVPNTKAATKAEAINRTAAAAKKDTQPVSVKIHKADGTFQEERTYPRSADPRRSKG